MYLISDSRLIFPHPILSFEDIISPTTATNQKFHFDQTMFLMMQNSRLIINYSNQNEENNKNKKFVQNFFFSN